MCSIGKPDNARKTLARFHSATNDINSPLVDLEMREIDEKIAIDGADSALPDFNALVGSNLKYVDREMVGLPAFVQDARGQV